MYMLIIIIILLILGRFFTMVDEELAKAFSVYCGISIYHVRGGDCCYGYYIH